MSIALRGCCYQATASRRPGRPTSCAALRAGASSSSPPLSSGCFTLYTCTLSEAHAEKGKGGGGAAAMYRARAEKGETEKEVQEKRSSTAPPDDGAKATKRCSVGTGPKALLETERKDTQDALLRPRNSLRGTLIPLLQAITIPFKCEFTWSFSIVQAGQSVFFGSYPIKLWLLDLLFRACGTCLASQCTRRLHLHYRRRCGNKEGASKYPVATLAIKMRRTQRVDHPRGPGQRTGAQNLGLERDAEI